MELVLAVIRQESEFDENAISYVGARGLMQLMPYTAKLVAKQAKLPYSKNKLKNPDYNIKLGSYYLAGLLEEYEGSYPFALAAYNAGPKESNIGKKLMETLRKERSIMLTGLNLSNLKKQEITFNEF